MSSTSLIVEMGSRSRPFDLHTDIIRVGRDDQCELVLPFDWVYPEHFTIHWRAGVACVRATAGQTLLNSRPLTSDFTPLHPGDELRIPSPAGKPISILITQLGSTPPITQPVTSEAPSPTPAEPIEEPPHPADSHMAAIAAVTVGILVVGIGLAVYIALSTATGPTRLASAPPTLPATPDTSSEISDLKSPIPDPTPPTPDLKSEVPKSEVPAPQLPSSPESPDLKSEISNLKSQLPTTPTQSAMGNRQLEIDPALSSALAARQSHRQSATHLLTTAPRLPEPLRTEILTAVAARLSQDASPSTVTIDPSATVQGDGQTAVLRAPITITNARAATYRTQAVALLTPSPTGWSITYLEIQ